MEPAWRHKVEQQKIKEGREARIEGKSEGKKGDTAWSGAEDMDSPQVDEPRASLNVSFSRRSLTLQTQWQHPFRGMARDGKP
ncbi:uncharacterized protein TrAFT101_000729 [Trichoderma asperellum]|uniref:uncharacterized protein n=1 Tax=Trichoderma asperellum TaxID=101201 RepID=UPI00332FFD7F|nr:hypothetical protein TrAFT101_000729 [Trichoderma asperellum]